MEASRLRNEFYLGCPEFLHRRATRPNLRILEPFKHTLMAQRNLACKVDIDSRHVKRLSNGILVNACRELYYAKQHRSQVNIRWVILYPLQETPVRKKESAEDNGRLDRELLVSKETMFG